ncbi:branched-chain amino acid ABC transporter substrate-binding protein, partial [Camelimonas abortus]
DDLTRENVMKAALSLRDFKPGMIYEGITMNTGPGDHFPFEEMQIMVFRGDRWIPEGGVISAKPKVKDR